MGQIFSVQTISDVYYLNITTKIFEKQIEICNKCNGLGNVKDNKCTEYISIHEFRTDFEDEHNYYPKCDKNY